MATGRLAAVQTTTGTVTTVYTVPAGKKASFTVNICNTSDYDIVLQFLALAANGSPTASEYLEYNQVMNSGSVLERSGLLLDEGKLVVVKSSGPITILVYGYEE